MKRAHWLLIKWHLPDTELLSPHLNTGLSIVPECLKTTAIKLCFEASEGFCRFFLLFRSCSRVLHNDQGTKSFDL